MPPGSFGSKVAVCRVWSSLWVPRLGVGVQGLGFGVGVSALTRAPRSNARKGYRQQAHAWRDHGCVQDELIHRHAHMRLDSQTAYQEHTSESPWLWVDACRCMRWQVEAPASDVVTFPSWHLAERYRPINVGPALLLSAHTSQIEPTPVIWSVFVAFAHAHRVPACLPRMTAVGGSRTRG